MKNIIFILLILGLAGCAKNSEQPIVEDREEPDVIINNFKDRYNSGLQKIWMVDSKYAEIYNKKKFIYLKDVYVEFYRDNKFSSSVKADKGMIDNSFKKVLAQSNVVVKSDDGSLLYTRTLTYEDSISKFVTEDYVKIIRPKGDIIEGIGMEADKNLEKIVIKKKVKGKMKNVK